MKRWKKHRPSLKIEHRLTWRFMTKNRWRTSITIIGVIICVAMITAVSVIVPSALQAMQKSIEQSQGRLHVAVLTDGYDDALALRQDERVVQGVITADARMTDRLDEDDDDAQFYGLHMVNSFADLQSVLPSFTLQAGSFPAAARDVLITQVAADHSAYKLGDMITLYRDGKALSLRVCGIVDYPLGSEDDLYVLSTAMDEADQVGVALRLKDTKHFDDRLEELKSIYAISAEDIEYNWQLLYSSGIYKGGIFTAVFLSGGVVALLILIGGVSLIYNAFAISLNERMTALAMLSSVGATKKQIRSSILFEALLIGGVAIPIGYVCGIGGIAITFACVNPLLAFLENAMISELSVVIKPSMLVFTLIYSILLLLCSAWLPARKLYKNTTIDVLRQHTMIRIRKKRRKNHPLLRRLAGMEGVLGAVYMDRSRYRYRFTLSSIIVCMLLFLVSWSFIQILDTSFTSILYTDGADAEVNIVYRAEEKKQQEQALSRLRQLTHVNNSYTEIRIDQLRLSDIAQLDEETVQHYQDLTVYDYPDVTLYALCHEDFQQYCQRLGMDGKAMDTAGVLLVNEGIDAHGDTSYGRGVWLKEQQAAIDTYFLAYFYEDGSEERSDYHFPILTYVDEAPVYLDPAAFNGSIQLVTCMEQLDALGLSQQELERLAAWINVHLYTDDAKALEEELQEVTKIISNSDQLAVSFTNYRLYKERQEAQKLLLAVFLYGFLTLLIFVCTANILNTVYTGMQLRKREFAMLKSCGLSTRGLKKLLYTEGALYGIRTCLYAIPIGLVLIWLIYQLFSTGYVTEMVFPWQAIGIGSIGVFLLIFLTMGYAIHKTDFSDLMELIKKENI